MRKEVKKELMIEPIEKINRLYMSLRLFKIGKKVMVSQMYICENINDTIVE